jgi:hypothetical protein
MTRQYLVVCDVCRLELKHKVCFRPPKWHQVTFTGDDSTFFDICPTCSERILQWIDDENLQAARCNNAGTQIPEK